MPTIRISKEVEDYIKNNGTFGETHDDVLRRVLKIEKQFKAKRVKSTGNFTTQEAFRVPLIKVLWRATGNALPTKKAIEQIKSLVDLKPGDHKRHWGGDIRWRNNIQWMRNQLVREGILVPMNESGRGIWRLSKSGLEYAKTLTS